MEYIEKNYNKADVIVLNLPVASGKSYIAHTIQSWLGNGTTGILTNNNILVEQYSKDFPKLAAVYGKGYVNCNNTAEPKSEWSSCAERYKWAYQNKKRKYCPDCPYWATHKRFYARSRFNYVTNFYKYVNLKGQFQTGGRDTLVIDEAHNSGDALKMFNSKKVWQHDFNYLECLDSDGRLDREAMLWRINKKLDRKPAPQWLYQELVSQTPKYILRMDTDWYYGDEKPCLTAQPVDIRGLNNPIWGDRNKLILMSATIGQNDIVELGLDQRRVYYHEAESCIPADRRPIFFDPVGKILGTNLRESALKVGAKLKELMNRYESKGVVHATYAQAQILKELSGDSGRLMFHNRDNKKAVYEEFRAASEGKVLVASGLYEGIDLPDDLGRWQVLAKIPWLNIGEPAIAYASEIDPEWYTWSTAKQVLQACGRICRKPDDWGDTFIIDETFRRLYTGNQSYWPNWWRESLHGI